MPQKTAFLLKTGTNNYIALQCDIWNNNYNWTYIHHVYNKLIKQVQIQNILDRLQIGWGEVIVWWSEKKEGPFIITVATADVLQYYMYLYTVLFIRGPYCMS